MLLKLICLLVGFLDVPLNVAADGAERILKSLSGKLKVNSILEFECHIFFNAKLDCLLNKVSLVHWRLQICLVKLLNRVWRAFFAFFALGLGDDALDDALR